MGVGVTVEVGVTEGVREGLGVTPERLGVTPEGLGVRVFVGVRVGGVAVVNKACRCC